MPNESGINCIICHNIDVGLVLFSTVPRRGSDTVSEFVIRYRLVYYECMQLFVYWYKIVVDIEEEISRTVSFFLFTNDCICIVLI